jgi:hypothetical protein
MAFSSVFVSNSLRLRSFDRSRRAAGRVRDTGAHA